MEVACDIVPACDPELGGRSTSLADLNPVQLGRNLTRPNSARCSCVVESLLPTQRALGLFSKHCVKGG